MISATGSGKSGTPRKGSRFSCPLQETGRRSRRKDGNGRRDFRAGKSPAGTSEGQNRPQSAATARQFSRITGVISAQTA